MAAVATLGVGVKTGWLGHDSSKWVLVAALVSVIGLTKIVLANIGRKDIPSWLSLDNRALSGKLISLPARADLDVNLNEQLIVEFYSR